MDDDDFIEWANALLERAPSWLDDDADQYELIERYVRYLEHALTIFTLRPSHEFDVEWDAL